MPTDMGFFEFFIPLCGLGFVLAAIDIAQGIIPDWLNLTIAVLGLGRAIGLEGVGGGLEALCEGLLIDLTFWLLRRIDFSLRQIHGLGLGDVKFLTAAGIWIGVSGLPALLLVAASTALATAGMLHVAGSGQRDGEKIGLSRVSDNCSSGTAQSGLALNTCVCFGATFGAVTSTAVPDGGAFNKRA